MDDVGEDVEEEEEEELVEEDEDEEEELVLGEGSQYSTARVQVVP